MFPKDTYRTCARNLHIGPYEDLATVKRRKLKWYGHLTRSDGITKVTLQGTVEGRRRRGRPKKSWIDNIAEWTGKSFADTQTMAHNRQEWRVRDLMKKYVIRDQGKARQKWSTPQHYILSINVICTRGVL